MVCPFGQLGLPFWATAFALLGNWLLSLQLQGQMSTISSGLDPAY